MRVKCVQARDFRRILQPYELWAAAYPKNTFRFRPKKGPNVLHLDGTLIKWLCWMLLPDFTSPAWPGWHTGPGCWATMLHIHRQKCASLRSCHALPPFSATCKTNCAANFTTNCSTSTKSPWERSKSWALPPHREPTPQRWMFGSHWAPTRLPVCVFTWNQRWKIALTYKFALDARARRWTTDSEWKFPVCQHQSHK